jgi:hypothetical protein
MVCGFMTTTFAFASGITMPTCLKFSRLPRTKRHAPVTPEPFTLENKIMTPRAKTIMLAFTLVSVLAAPFAEAARLGGGKSAGMRRSAPTKSYQQPTPMPAPAAAPQAAPQAQPKKGPGIGTAIAAGAAGAAPATCWVRP